MEGKDKTIVCEGLATVHIRNLTVERRSVKVEKIQKSLHVPFDYCETAYPMELIEFILTAKGPAYLCDEILRDESPEYVQHDLKWSTLSYVNKDAFVGKRLLDFGCGSGGSSVSLSRMLPKTEIVGVELEKRLLNVAQARAEYYGIKNVSFHVSPSPDSLPDHIGKFDFVMFSAVYEHLLPNERKPLLKLIWSALKPGGVLFLNGTPNKHFPLEMHTTGLPLINYLPDCIAHSVSRKFSKRNLENDSWEALLRKGIRGGSISEVLKNLSGHDDVPVLLEPSEFGLSDRLDLWLALSSKSIGRSIVAKKIYRLVMKPFLVVFGIELLPELALAIKKSPN